MKGSLRLWWEFIPCLLDLFGFCKGLFLEKCNLIAGTPVPFEHIWEAATEASALQLTQESG